MIARLGLAVLMLAAVSGLALFRVNAQLDIALGTLTDQVPAQAGIVTVVLSDARAAFDPFLLARGQEDTVGDWIGANLIGGTPAAQEQTALVRAFADSTQLVVWTHRGFSKFTRNAMSRELERAVLKARAAGAEVNIVAQGADADVVIETMKRTKAGARRIVLLGVNKPLLKLDGVAQLAEVWSTREIGSSIQIRLIGGRHDGETLDLEALWPNLSSGADSVDKSLKLVRMFVESPMTIDQMLEEKQALARDAQFKKAYEAEARAKAAAEPDAARTASPAARAPAPAPASAPAARPANAAGFAVPEGWSTAPVLVYDGPNRKTGWYVSAPGTEKVADLTDDRRSVSVTIDRCEQYLQLSAFPASKLGPGESHEAALQALFEESNKSFGKSNEGYHEKFAGDAVRLTVHGRPAVHFETAGENGAGSTYFVVETGREVIYLVRRYYQSMVASATGAACARGFKGGFKTIAESIRPAN